MMQVGNGHCYICHGETTGIEAHICSGVPTPGACPECAPGGRWDITKIGQESLNYCPHCGHKL